ncbi:D-2-hydroxyacid dehydrogenase [Tissierella creatinophila]|uniref:Putative 2-hydroxyacid dehydrogenase n=1 Tax=Tissierella creatinophila DSM 6911 TaxID=1123403 RepID=A0A1U7M3D7_TISCR|nr:D-2-hydroxyacid dehydrogenase [Tissierella creatinophila]OLS01796.1 putative 2-hydroxyacid dehydrogenase [Tissierella creatinophila DSM 6911]
MKIVVLDGDRVNPGDISWDGFRELGDLKVYDMVSFNLKDSDLIIEKIGDAEAILINKTPIDRKIIEAASNLKYIGVMATGYNTVDLDSARENGVVVTNIPTYGTDAVAQMTFALLLELTNHVSHHNSEVKKGRWKDEREWCFWDKPLMELKGKTMGIIGFGRIGQKVGEIAKAFDMKVLSTTSRDDKLDEVLKNSDIISLNCPLTEKTRGIINKESIAKMKDGVLIINTARGALIVEKDLKEALDSGKVGGAGVDTVSFEPIKDDNPLLSSKNIIITPHISWAPIETRARLMDIAVDNFRNFLDGKIVNQVN